MSSCQKVIGATCGWSGFFLFRFVLMCGWMGFGGFWKVLRMRIGESLGEVYLEASEMGDVMFRLCGSCVVARRETAV